MFDRLEFAYVPSRDVAADVVVERGADFEIPHGPGVEAINPGPQRLSVSAHAAGR
jgi:hypothetical protein